MLTEEEAFVVNMVRVNKAFPPKEIEKKYQLGPLTITWNWRSRHNLWGRFGGGWQWEFGFVAGGNTLILNLLTSSLRFVWKKRERKATQ